jgi:hypothetical protein
MVLLLAGCSTSKPPVAVSMPWPQAPSADLKSCPDLNTVDPATNKLSDVLTVVTDNYTVYYLCAGIVDDWNTWYKTQKRIYESTQ